MTDYLTAHIIEASNHGGIKMTMTAWAVWSRWYDRWFAWRCTLGRNHA